MSVEDATIELRMSPAQLDSVFHLKMPCVAFNDISFFFSKLNREKKKKNIKTAKKKTKIKVTVTAMRSLFSHNLFTSSARHTHAHVALFMLNGFVLEKKELKKVIVEWTGMNRFIVFVVNVTPHTCRCGAIGIL